jgi:hypothetical protein
MNSVAHQAGFGAQDNHQWDHIGAWAPSTSLVQFLVCAKAGYAAVTAQ